MQDMNRIFLFVLSSLLCMGCIQRTVSITSNPPGALAYLNDEEVGRTPVEVPFTFYGVYDVRLERDGYMPLWTTHKAEAPWWEALGPDLVAEFVGGKVQLNWHFEMEPLTEVSDEALIDRARQLRATLTKQEWGASELE